MHAQDWEAEPHPNTITSLAPLATAEWPCSGPGPLPVVYAARQLKEALVAVAQEQQAQASTAKRKSTIDLPMLALGVTFSCVMAAPLSAGLAFACGAFVCILG